MGHHEGTNRDSLNRFMDDTTSPAQPSAPPSIRVVAVVGVYSHITQSGRGVGLLERQLRDVTTQEVLKRGRARNALLRYAEQMGWQESPTDPAPLQTPA